jgi:hypothetical protein
MKRLIAIVSSLIALLAVAAPAHAAAPSCSRGGMTQLSADGGVRVVFINVKRAKNETRHIRVYGCWTASGRRFTLFEARDFGLDEIEHDHFEIVDGRFIGAIREFEGGVSDSRIAGTWDAQKHVAVHATKPCDEVSSGDFGGVEDAVFFHGGGMAYTCFKQSHIADAHGDRLLEPTGTSVTQLAVAHNSAGFGDRLYYTVDETTLKTLAL